MLFLSKKTFCIADIEQRKCQPRAICKRIAGGVKGQSTASDVFSLAKTGETIFKKAELGRRPFILVQALNADPTKRPGLDKIVHKIF